MNDSNNPYSVDESAQLPPEQSGSIPAPGRMRTSVFAGAVISVASAFPTAMLLAYFYRFPIPLAGYQSGMAAVPAAAIAVLIYGIALGGFPLLAIIGGISGWSAHRRSGEPKRRRRWLICLAMSGTFVTLLILANLDYVIGPW